MNGVKRRLLDEVDVISAVSGGTLPATYYGLRGEKTFEEFEAKVLSRNLEIELAKRIIRTRNWFRLPSGTFGKSDLFAELYDETVFDHATFGDLKRANGPFVIINGTDITIGARFIFTQDYFERHLRRSLEGDAGTGHRHIDGAAAAAHADHTREPRRDLRQEAAGLAGRRRGRTRRSETPGRAPLRARALQAYANPARPYIHLFDGGLSEISGWPRCSGLSSS